MALVYQSGARRLGPAGGHRFPVDPLGCRRRRTDWADPNLEVLGGPARPSASRQAAQKVAVRYRIWVAQAGWSAPITRVAAVDRERAGRGRRRRARRAPPTGEDRREHAGSAIPSRLGQRGRAPHPHGPSPGRPILAARPGRPGAAHRAPAEPPSVRGHLHDPLAARPRPAGPAVVSTTWPGGELPTSAAERLESSSENTSSSNRTGGLGAPLRPPRGWPDAAPGPGSAAPPGKHGSEPAGR